MLLQTGDIPTGIICANDALALGALSTLSKHHISVPEQIQVIGFDNTRESHYSSPPLSTVDPHVMQYAQLAVQQLIARIEGSSEKVHVLTTGYRLVERHTTIQ